MKKVFAVIGSPHKGETYNEVKKIESSIAGNHSGEIEFEYVFLRELGLEECMGCHNCIVRGEEFCFQNDKVHFLKAKMLESDLVILSSPVYNDHVTALMKKMFDYMTFLWHRPEMFGRKFVGISSGGGMFKSVFSYMKKNVECWGGEWVAEFGVPHYDSLTPKFAAKTDVSRERFIEKLKSALDDRSMKTPSLSKLIYFNVWKINARACKDYLKRDYEYWAENSLFESDYYYNVKIPFYKKLTTSILKRVIHSFMKKVYKGY